MSAQEEFLLTQRILNVFFQRGHTMNRFTINYLLQQLNEHIERMIILNNAVERNHVHEQTLLLQQLNEFNDRVTVEERQPQSHIQDTMIRQFEYINPDINYQEDMQNEHYMAEESERLSEQTDHIYIAEPFTTIPFILNRAIRNNPIERSKVIARKKLEEPCPYDCSICQETPKHKDAVCTECNHYYCKGCWESWMNAEGSNKKCPTCRKDMPRITIFKARAPNRRNVV